MKMHVKMDLLWLASPKNAKASAAVNKETGEFSYSHIRYTWVLDNDDLYRKSGKKTWRNAAMYDNMKAAYAALTHHFSFSRFHTLALPKQHILGSCDASSA